MGRKITPGIHTFGPLEIFAESEYCENGTVWLSWFCYVKFFKKEWSITISRQGDL